MILEEEEEPKPKELWTSWNIGNMATVADAKKVEQNIIHKRRDSQLKK